jgi:hypothetical protein
MMTRLGKRPVRCMSIIHFFSEVRWFCRLFNSQDRCLAEFLKPRSKVWAQRRRCREVVPVVRLVKVALATEVPGVVEVMLYDLTFVYCAIQVTTANFRHRVKEVMGQEPGEPTFKWG